MRSRGYVLTQFCFLGSVLVGQDGLYASSSGRLALPGELPALSITSIHLEKRVDHQKLPRCSLGSQGMLWSYVWPCAQVSSEDDPKDGVNGTKQGPEKTLEAMLSNRRGPQGLVADPRITFQMCTCSQLGRSRRGI